jgi:hypothetical protein
MKMIKEIEMSIKMYTEMKAATETEKMKVYYDGKIDGLKDALKLIRKANKK